MKSHTVLLAVGLLLGFTVASCASQDDLPDPRYRVPLGLWELDVVASMVARASGFPLRGSIQVAERDDVPLARITGPPGGAVLIVNPRFAKEVPPNSWAFIIGHEFAHQTDAEAQGVHGQSSPAIERRADLVGAEYARAAGFDLAAHLGWAIGLRDEGSETHGSNVGRVMALAKHFHISRHEIDRQRRTLFAFGWPHR